MSLGRQRPAWQPRVVAGAMARTATDEEVLDALESGDPRFGAMLYERVHGAVEATLVRMLGRGDPDYEDLVQTSFEQIVTTLARRRYARACNLRSWAAAVTCNVALNALRSRRTQRRYFDRNAPAEVEAVHSPAPHPERAAAVQAELSRLRAALAAMSPKLAQALVLHDALGYEVSEIAVLTGASVAAAQARLSRGRRELKERLPLPERDSGGGP